MLSVYSNATENISMPDTSRLKKIYEKKMIRIARLGFLFNMQGDIIAPFYFQG